jgi:hypothetical protein
MRVKIIKNQVPKLTQIQTKFGLWRGSRHPQLGSANKPHLFQIILHLFTASSGTESSQTGVTSVKIMQK